jgi:exo-beta-1,3-glucanase (GH17 family)
MQKSTTVIVAMVALANLALWSFLNRPQAAPEWTGTIKGVSFSPFQRGQDPLEGKFPTLEEIDKDLLFLKGKVAKVRTMFSARGSRPTPLPPTRDSASAGPTARCRSCGATGAPSSPGADLD